MKCAHCTDKIPSGLFIQLLENGEQKYFCCNACLAVYQTIRDNQLGDYYRQREQTAKPALAGEHDIWLDTVDTSTWVKQQIDGSFTTRLYLEGMHCTACAWLIEHYLNKHPDISHARVHYGHSYVDVSWSNAAFNLRDAVQLLANIGYRAWPFQADIIRERQLNENNTLLKRIGISAILMMQIGMFSIGLYAGDYLGISAEHQQLLRVFSLIFALPILYFSALPFFVSAFYSLKMRQPDMNISISLAITGLYSSSIYSVMSKTGDIYFDSAAMFCLFILTARYIEKKSRTDMQPSQPVLPTLVTTVVDQQLKRCSIDNINIGDTVIIHEGDIIALDGIVISGVSMVSEAFLNGESLPIKKQANDQVYAGSQNHDGQLTIRVSCKQEHALVNKINQLSQQAAEEKPLFISLTDKIAARFSLIILTLTASTFFAWQFIDSSRAFWVALSVLVVSCPCALSLAAPTALSSVHFRLRKLGIYIQSIGVLETLNRVNHIIFDKTGTLTEGVFTLCETHITGNIQKDVALFMATAIEKNSLHPLATAFKSKASPYLAEDVHIYAGLGIEADIEQQRYRMGSAQFIRQWHAKTQAPDNRQWLGLCNKDEVLAWFRVDDQLRDNAAKVIHQLQQHARITMLSGDASDAVQKTANKLNIDDYRSACSSQDKLNHINQLQDQGEITLMVGDGINDAPVLAKSHVSATLLHASSWVKNTADMILLDNNLANIPLALDAAKKYRRILIENFLWAFSYNTIAIPFAMAGFISPWMAALGMSLSSIVVVLNSRRLSRIDGQNHPANVSSFTKPQVLSGAQ